MHARDVTTDVIRHS